MELNRLEDLFEIDHEKLKAAENKRVITKIKQLLKAGTKSEARAEKEASDYPYEAVSIVGNKFVTLRFDLESKEGRVTNVQVDTRDDRGRNHMAGKAAREKVESLIRKQKETNNG